MIDSRPPALVSIGVPVFNEARFLAQTLDALLAQDYSYVEILVSDNGSLDATASIAQRYAERHPHLRVHRYEQNQGASENWAGVLRQARGEYFMWASGHDLWSPNFLSECVALLERDPTHLIAFGCCRWIDAEGGDYPKQSGWTDTRGLLPAARFFTVLWGNMHPILGLMRTSVARSTGVPPYVGGDLIFLCTLALQGHFVHAPRAAWCRREFRPIESYADRMARYQKNNFGPRKPLIDRFLPLLRVPVELLRLLWRARLPALDKVLILLALLPAMLAKLVLTRRAQRR